MERRSVNRFAVPIGLLFLTSIPIVMSLVRVVQIPLDALPDDAAYFDVVPIGHFLHALAGATFGILGPIQFGRVFANRFGTVHRVMGRVFFASGIVLILSAIRLLWAFPGTSTVILDITRLLATAGLAIALSLAFIAIKGRDIPAHRDWIIRAYAIGMGSATVSFILFPIYIITGEPPNGLAADLAFVASWVINIGIAEMVIRRLHRSTSNRSFA
jgi:hypothetical protein